MTGQRKQLGVYETKVLAFLARSTGNGGYTAGMISREAGLGSTRSLMAVNRIMVLLPMVDRGWLAPLDDQKPTIFCITDAGRRALTAEGRP